MFRLMVKAYQGWQCALTDFAPIRVSASIYLGEGMSAPPRSTMLLPRYCSYFTSHRYVVYSPTKKGWSFG